MSLPQVIAFSDELGKLAGLPVHPAISGASIRRLPGLAKPPAASGLTEISKATSPAALAPPPNISA
jgi:hypothetical protein